MAQQPLTWRNISSPNFQTFDPTRGFAAGGAQLNKTAEQMLTLQEAADKQATNQANAQALLTGQLDPNMNPRADAAVVGQTLTDYLGANADRAETEANTARLGQETAKLEQETDKYRYENGEEYRKMIADLRAAETRRNNALAGKDEQAAAQAEAEYQQKLADMNNTMTINKAHEEYVQELTNHLYLEENPPGSPFDPPPSINNLSRAAYLDYYKRAEALAQGPQGRIRARELFRSLEGASPTAWSNSIYGKLDDKAIEVQGENAKAQAALQIAEQEAGVAQISEFKNNNFKNAVVSNGEIVRGTDKQVADGKLASSQIWGALYASAGQFGVPLSIIQDMQQDKDKNQLIKDVHGAFPNGEIFTNIVLGHVKGVGGKLDPKLLRQDMALGGESLIKKSRAALAVDRFSTQTPGSGTGAGNTSAPANSQTILGNDPSLAPNAGNAGFLTPGGLFGLRNLFGPSTPPEEPVNPLTQK